MMTFASILPVMTAAAPPSTGKDAAKPKLISTLEDNFTIRVLAPDSRGNLNLQNSNPLVLNVVGLARPDSVTVPFTGLANVDAPVFSLKNKKLIAGSSPATLLPKDDDGLSAFVFFPGIPTEPVDFIATEALDSYGNGFLRLGSGDGKFVRLRIISLNPTTKCLLSCVIIQGGECFCVDTNTLPFARQESICCCRLQGWRYFLQA